MLGVVWVGKGVILVRIRDALVRATVILCLVGQFMVITSISSVAQAPVKRKAQKLKKKRKLSKNVKMARLRKKINFFKRRAAVNKAAKNKMQKKVNNYLARMSKAKTRKGKHKLLKARLRSLKTVRKHSRKISSYLKKVSFCSARLIRYMGVKKVLAGRASWYNFVGRRTASGEIFKTNGMTAAMRGFRGRTVKVVNTSNNKAVYVRVNDHGPARYTGRVIDMSLGSFARIASPRQGVISKVKVYVF